MTSAMTKRTESMSIWDDKAPWASIAHAFEWWDGAPEIIAVPGDPPAPSFSVDGVTVQVRRVDDLLGVACWGHQAVGKDAKELCLLRMRRGEP